MAAEITSHSRDFMYHGHRKAVFNAICCDVQIYYCKGSVGGEVPSPICFSFHSGLRKLGSNSLQH